MPRPLTDSSRTADATVSGAWPGITEIWATGFKEAERLLAPAAGFWRESYHRSFGKIKRIMPNGPRWPANLSRPAGAGRASRPSGSGGIPRAGITPMRRSRPTERIWPAC
jgi:hypothetical protein